MTKLAFMFPGQGSVEPGMGQEIAESVAEAMAIYEIGSEATGLDLQGLCFSGSLEELVQTELQQPTLIATSLAINAALRANGITPDFVVGHSVGEFAALAAAESMDIGAAMALVRDRGVATAAAAREHPGSMAAILGLADDVVEDICAQIENVWPANYNCPGQIVISGETASVEQCCETATEHGARRAIKLKVTGAFHSPLVAQAAELLRPAIDRIDFQAPTSKFISTVTAKLEEAQRFPSLLIEQLTAPVRFAQAVAELLAEGATTFVEVGPGNVLSGLLKRIDSSVRAISVNDLHSLETAVHELG